MKKIVLILLVVIVGVSGGGYFFYENFMKKHPAIAACEEGLITSLKSPSSYKPIQYIMDVRSPNEAILVILFEASNSFGALLRGEASFKYEITDRARSDVMRNDNLKDIYQGAYLGTSPFDRFQVKSIWINGKQQGQDLVLLVQASQNLHSTKYKGVPGPGAITSFDESGNPHYKLGRLTYTPGKLLPYK